MKLSYYEVRDLERFLGTLATCDYMGIAPKLSENDAFLVAMMEGKMKRWMGRQERG
jgi:hypothetical protein